MHRRQFLLRLAGLAAGLAAMGPVRAADTAAIAGLPGFNLYLAKPKTAGKYPGIVIVHDRAGLDAHVRNFADRLAEQGYLALAVDYAGLATAPGGVEALKRDDIVKAGRGAVAALAARPDCTGKIGAVGFGWGGLAVGYLVLAEPTVRAAVTYYGRQPLYFLVDEYRLINAALMLHYASRDI